MNKKTLQKIEELKKKSMYDIFSEIEINNYKTEEKLLEEDIAYKALKEKCEALEEYTEALEDAQEYYKFQLSLKNKTKTTYCGWCNHDKNGHFLMGNWQNPNPIEVRNISLGFYDKRAQVGVNGEVIGKIEIKYCPMCGREF